MKRCIQQTWHQSENKTSAADQSLWVFQFRILFNSFFFFLYIPHIQSIKSRWLSFPNILRMWKKTSLLCTALILILARDHSLLDGVIAFWLVCLFSLCPPTFPKTAGKVFLSRWEANDVTVLRILPMVFYLIQSKVKFFQRPVRSYWPCYFSKIPSHLLSPLIFLFQSPWYLCFFCRWPALPPWGLCTCNSFC